VCPYPSLPRLREREGWGQVGGLPLPHRLDGPDALLAQDALHPANGVAVRVKQPPDAAQKINILRTIIAPAAAALHRPDMRETTLPEPQHMLWQIKFVCDLADGAECVGRLVQSRLLSRVLWAVRLTTGAAVRTCIDALLENR